MSITAADLRAMPMPQAVVAFMRACRTFDDVGDIDGPWHDVSKPLFLEASGLPDMAAYCEWERAATEAELFAVYDKAIAAALARVPT